MAPQMQQQTMFGGGGFDNNMIMTQNCAPMGYASNFCPGAKQIQTNTTSLYNRLGSSSYKSFLNFLNNSPTVINNLQPNADGHIECSIEADKYSTILILAFDENTVSQSIVDVSTAIESISKRDLSLSTPLNPKKFYNETRNSSLLEKSNSTVIEDITSTNYLIIDSLEKVSQVQDEIVKIAGQGGGIQNFNFLLNWHSLTTEEKSKKYSGFMSNEINLFLYFKDREYFDEVVKPFILNKMEKGFVDYWLIGDHEKVLTYKSMDTFNTLNAFEKCLLISEVLKDDVDEAKILAEHVRLIAGEDEPNVKVFDLVINLNNSLEVEAPQCPNAPMPMIGLLSLDSNNDNNMIRNNLVGGAFCTFGGSGGHGGSGAMLRSSQQNQNIGLNRMMKMPDRSGKHGAGLNSKMDKWGLFDEDDDSDASYQKQARMEFQEAEVAVEYCETHYYGSPDIQYRKIKENLFWSDFAQHIVKTHTTDNFLSSNFIIAIVNMTESLAALSVLSLPFHPPKNIITPHGGKGNKIEAAENLILLKKEIKEAEGEINNDLLVIHRFFDPNNRNSEKEIGEFLVNKVYQIETIITNVSSKKKDFQILWQIPEGSLPLGTTNYQKSENKFLDSYSTTTFAYYFYFPQTGKFTQFPANIIIDNKVVARAQECNFEVVEERTEVSDETFRDIILSENKDSILDFLRTANLYKGEKGFTFNDILWMMKDKDFFKKTTDILRERRIYSNEVWKFSSFHKDEQTFKEVLKTSRISNIVGFYFESSLIKSSPLQENIRHLDYFPMLNARAHKLGDHSKSGILNYQLKETYNCLLIRLVEKKNLDNEDYLTLAYYYLLQDRIKEAITIFQRIKPADFEAPGRLKMQYDYMRAYLDFFIGEETGFQIAKKISKEYSNYPILSWKVLFREIFDQLEEFEEGIDYDKDIDLEDESKKKSNMKKSINLEPILHCELEGKNIKAEYNNIQKVAVKYYVIDPEVMFSRTPFLNQSTEDFAYVKPMETQEVEFNDKLKTHTFEILEKLQKENLVIEVSGKSKQSFLTYFSTTLKISINENFGELKVTDQDEKPIPKVYVKTFSKEKDGKIKFFKDGYTDIRGKFEYAQINSKKLSTVDKFAIFAEKEDYGSTTREARVPPNVSNEVVSDLKFLPTSQMNKWNQQATRAGNKLNRKK